MLEYSSGGSLMVLSKVAYRRRDKGHFLASYIGFWMHEQNEL